MTAGNRLPTAVPLVVSTAAGRPVAREIPSAVKAATRSSIRTCTRKAPLASAAAAAYATGADRDPGATTICSMPARARALSAVVAVSRLGVIM